MAAEDGGENEALVPVAEPFHAEPVTGVQAHAEATAHVTHADAREWGSAYANSIPEAEVDHNAAPSQSSHSFQTFGLTKTTYPRHYTDIGMLHACPSHDPAASSLRRPSLTTTTSRRWQPGWAALFYASVAATVGGFVYVRFFQPDLFWEASNLQYISNDKVPR